MICVGQSVPSLDAFVSQLSEPNRRMLMTHAWYTFILVDFVTFLLSQALLFRRNIVLAAFAIVLLISVSTEDLDNMFDPRYKSTKVDYLMGLAYHM